jgi:hypothetical protein
MGEYAKYNGERIKIGTCEDMYYLRYDQRFLVFPESGNVNPRAKDELKVIRFRFPFPEEDNVEPGTFEDPFKFIRIDDVQANADVDHQLVQFTASNGYVVSLPCPEGPNPNENMLSRILGFRDDAFVWDERTGITYGEIRKLCQPLKIHKNGYGGPVRLVQQAVRNGKLVPVFQCGACSTAWRVEDVEDLEKYLNPLREKMERETAMRKEYWQKVIDRMQIEAVQE